VTQRSVRRAAFASVCAALLLIAGKAAAYLASGSVAVLSSLIDSSVDLLASGVTLISVLHAAKPADRHHRFGHGKAEPLAALVQAAFVVGSAVLLTIQAGAKALDPQPITNEGWALGVMGFSIVITALLVSFQRRVVTASGSVAIRADSIHYVSDLATNAAVILTLVLVKLTGSAWWDVGLGFAVGAWLVWSATRIARGSLDLLMDRELPEALRAEIKQIVLAHPDARGLHDLRTRSSGTVEFIELHLELEGELSLTRAHEIADVIEQQLRAAFPKAEVLIHQEPAGLDDHRLDHQLGPAA
jgi:ferrous-iron efflux pump FieF